ncbi:MAG: MCP four helix bundle domain-containing protein, partial [Actinobacteria bacterium]|nr:MCP four helix bundle domain-containing protein [Actinomycetota bacterium]
MTVGKKLFITIFILSALAAVIGVMGLLNLKKFNEKVGELAFAVDRVDSVQNQRVEFQSLNSALHNYLKVRDDAAAQKLSDKIVALRETTDGLTDGLKDASTPPPPP